MIPESHKEDVIQSGIGFMRSITEAYGHEQGLLLWETIAATLDPDIKGQIFFAMLTGNVPGKIRVFDVNPAYTHGKIDQIKAIRAVSGWGLKESKDAIDDLWATKKPVFLDCKVGSRTSNLSLLRNVGLLC